MEDIKDLIPLTAQEKIQGALTFFNSLREIKISTQEEYDHSTDLLQNVKTTINGLEADRKAIVQPYDTKTRAVNAHYKVARDKLENAERVLKTGRAQFFAEQERKRQELQRKLQAEADEKARKEAEKAEAERKKAEAYREQGRLDMAEKAEARADRALETAQSVIAPVLEKTSAGAGSSMTEVFKCTVENEKMVILWCLENFDFVTCVELNLKALDRLVNSKKGMVTIPGAKVFKTFQERVRT